MNRTITLLDAVFPIRVERKKMKNLRLRLTEAGEVRMSAPKRTPDAVVERFLESNRGWLEKALVKQRQKVPAPRAETLEDGSPFRLLGVPLTVRIQPAAHWKMEARLEIQEFRIETPESDNLEKRRKKVEAWWREKAKELYCSPAERFLHLFPGPKKALPPIMVRTMTSRWGSCRIDGSRITLNYYLMRAPIECVEYVVVHELAHLQNPSHNREFYQRVAGLLPDWMQRRDRLTREWSG